jgi:outer membrane immunogenic protein
MKSTWLGIACASVLLFGVQSGLAFAADMALKAAPAPDAPPTWTGCYIGPQIGYASGYQSVIDPAANLLVTTVAPIGGLLGGAIGCNYQFGKFLIGIEDDMSWTETTGTNSDIPPNYNPTFSHSVRVPWLDTVRGRAGIAIDRSLVYATGGLAFANIVDSAVGQGVPGVL